MRDLIFTQKYGRIQIQFPSGQYIRHTERRPGSVWITLNRKRICPGGRGWKDGSWPPSFWRQAILSWSIAYFAALWVRFDCAFSKIPANYLDHFRYFVTPYALICVFVFALARMYKSVWRYISFSELFHAMIVSTVMSIAHAALIGPVVGRMPLSYGLFGWLLQMICVVGDRFAYRLLLYIRSVLRPRDAPAR